MNRTETAVHSRARQMQVILRKIRPRQLQGRLGARLLRSGLRALRGRFPVRRSGNVIACAFPARSVMAADKSKGTWYVSFERPLGKRNCARATETFPNEREAKKFAKTKLVDTPNVSAGTLNPHLPKRTIGPRMMLEWLKEPGEADLA
jgi:hypothetical protein